MDVKPIKLVPKKAGNGYISSFTINISLKEALQLGFINEDKTINNIEKIIDDGTLIIRKAPVKQGAFRFCDKNKFIRSFPCYYYST